MRISIIVAMAATLGAAPLALATAAQAQDAQPSAQGMHGSPNAAGYGKDRGMDKTGGDTMAMEPQAKDMKGPPNANGYDKK